MKIRKASLADLPQIMKIYGYAREQMRKNGNPNQWGTSRPYEEEIIKDIEKGNSYVIIKYDKIQAVFAFIIGNDPTYEVIEGKWLNSEPYGTVHRVASGGEINGVMNIILDFCKEIQPNIKIDTHKDNKIMRHILEKAGFTECGIIYISDGTPRIAYQRKFI